MSTETFRIEDGVAFVGDERIETTKVRYEEPTGRSHMRGRGFWTRLPNGWTLSTQWGTYNYGSNYDHDSGAHEWHEAALTVEIAAWPGESNRGGMHQWPDGDTVQGYLTAEQWRAVRDEVAGFPAVKS